MDDNYDRIIFPDKHYNFISPKAKFIKELSDHFPDEKQAIQDYLQLIDRSVKSGVSYFGNKALPNLISSLSYPFMSRKFMSFAGAIRVISNGKVNWRLSHATSLGC